jgi:hypothetical protein
MPRTRKTPKIKNSKSEIFDIIVVVAAIRPARFNMFPHVYTQEDDWKSQSAKAL